MRTNQNVVIGDPHPPKSVLEKAELLNTHAYIRNRDFHLLNETDVKNRKQAGLWAWQTNSSQFNSLPENHIPKDNIATGLMVLDLLAPTLSLQFKNEDITGLIENTRVAGRTERFVDGCEVMLDVGHNPLAARYLAKVIALANYDNIYAVVGMLADKDIANTLKPLEHLIDTWYFASLNVARGAKAEQLQQTLSETSIASFCFDNVTDAYKMANHHSCSNNSNSNDLVLVFGSFFTVAEVRNLLVEY